MFPRERTWLPLDIRLACNYMTLVILRCLLDETVSLAEVKARLSELTALAAAGEEVVITQWGKPVARLSRPDTPRRPVNLKLMRELTARMPKGKRGRYPFLSTSLESELQRFLVGGWTGHELPHRAGGERLGVAQRLHLRRRGRWPHAVSAVNGNSSACAY